jgi:hypothetical protein
MLEGVMLGEAQRTVAQLPVSGLRDYILSLATANGVSYIKTSMDRLTDTITRLSDDEVHLDEIEQLLIALERAGIVASGNVVPLHINYLREKLNVRSV